MFGTTFRLTTLVISLSLAAASLAAQAGRPPATPPVTRAAARPWHVRALESTKDLDPDSALALFDQLHFSPAYVKESSRDDRRALMAKIRSLVAATSTILINEDESGVHMMLDNADVQFTIEPSPPFAITSLRIGPVNRGEPPAPVTWEDLERRMKDAEANGFSGQIFARHGGREVLRASYGFADSASKRRTRPDDIYCIGSAPIDFTRTAALLLIERGKLGLDDLISKYVPNVPADKAALTIRMILDERSGLPNFHHIESDPDRDLTLIDRTTAIGRILSTHLLSAPGTRQEASHSSFGLLAAIIEIASGQTYQRFVRNEILKPAGMTRTGFYGETLGLPITAFATGYGPHSVGSPNVPANWGPVSWLVMGSGGMFSTADDLRKYHDAMASGLFFADKRPRRQIVSNVDGSERGYVLVYANNGNGDEVLMMSNAEQSKATRPLVSALSRLVVGTR